MQQLLQEKSALQQEVSRLNRQNAALQVGFVVGVVVGAVELFRCDECADKWAQLGKVAGCKLRGCRGPPSDSHPHSPFFTLTLSNPQELLEYTTSAATAEAGEEDQDDNDNDDGDADADSGCEQQDCAAVQDGLVGFDADGGSSSSAVCYVEAEGDGSSGGCGSSNGGCGSNMTAASELLLAPACVDAGMSREVAASPTGQLL